MDKNVANIFVIAETVAAESEKETILYDRFNSLIGKIFKTLSGKEYRPELSNMYPKTARTFLESAHELFNSNPVLTDVSGATDLLQIIDYSEKAIAIIGDTKSVKEKFKIDNRFIGRFNKNLTVKGMSVAGWIFPIKHHDLLKKIVEDHNTFNSPFAPTLKGKDEPSLQTPRTQKALFQ